MQRKINSIYVLPIIRVRLFNMPAVFIVYGYYIRLLVNFKL